jgi:ferrochelatase
MARRGVLLINLGSPASTDPKDVRNYLNEFLMDPYVIDLPWALRYPLVNWLITPRRSHTSAEAYRTIWTERGSPLIEYSRRFAVKLQNLVHFQYDVRWAMRYGQPSIESVVKDWNVEEILIVPMYPQYAESSTKTAFEAALACIPADVKTKVCMDFFDHEAFVMSQVRNIQAFIDEFKPDHLLLSYHGLPEHHLSKLYPQHCHQDAGCCAKVKESNRYCYRAQCFATLACDHLAAEISGQQHFHQLSIALRPSALDQTVYRLRGSCTCETRSKKTCGRFTFVRLRQSGDVGRNSGTIEGTVS